MKGNVLYIQYVLAVCMYVCVQTLHDFIFGFHVKQTDECRQ